MAENKRSRIFWIVPTAAIALLLTIYFWRGAHQVEAPMHPVNAQPNTSQSNKNLSAPRVTSLAAAGSQRSYAIAADGSVEVPLRFQLPGVSRVKTGASFKDWVAQYPVDAQEKITAFNKRHFGVYSINSPQQVAWMTENGYPMPEDVIAAEGLSDSDLRELARNRNDKAGFLLRERDLAALKENFTAYAAQGKTQSDFWQFDPNASQQDKDMHMNTELMQQSNSPFKGYMQAQDSILETEPLGIDAKVIAGLEWASRLGDFRASQFLTEYIYNDPVRQAMATAASAVSANDTQDIMRMRINGCTPVGAAPGKFIPGNFSPVE